MTASTWTRRFSSDLTMSAGTLVAEAPLDVTAPVFDGLQVIVALDSRMRSRINGCAQFDIAGAGVYVVLASGRHESEDRIAPHALQRFVRVGIDHASAARNGFDLDRIAHGGGERLYTDDIVVLRRPVTPALRAIAAQALACPLQGPMRDVYLAGKGLELAALATDALGAGDARRCRLGRADLERLEHARALALEHWQQPLALHELARRAGTNVNKLTAGFRQLFGVSVAEYVQRHRLQEAWRMLATGAYTVSEVAAFVGYTNPHFSTVFRRHFGFPPSQLAH